MQRLTLELNNLFSELPDATEVADCLHAKIARLSDTCKMDTRHEKKLGCLSVDVVTQVSSVALLRHPEEVTLINVFLVIIGRKPWIRTSCDRNRDI